MALLTDFVDQQRKTLCRASSSPCRRVAPRTARSSCSVVDAKRFWAPRERKKASFRPRKKPNTKRDDGKKITTVKIILKKKK